MAMSVQHPCDDKHALILGELSGNCCFPCNLCKLNVNGPAYCCWDCDIFLHKSCAELPLKVKFSGHSEHPNLSLTFDNLFKKYLYSCDDCSFFSNMASVVLDLNNSKEAEDKEMIRHFYHDHPLDSFNLNMPIKADCSICRQQMFGPLYGCLACGFLVHESCARLPKEIEVHPSHPHHNLSLLSDEMVFTCSACNSSNNKWLRYRHGYKCADCDFKLDVQCASSTLPSENQQEDGIKSIEHFSHEHSLSYFSMEKIDICCKACNDKLQGEVYGCPACIFFMHKSCLEELPREIVHFLHPDHPLVFQPKPRDDGGSFRCNACWVDSRGSVFTCEICQFDLDPVCALQALAAVKEGAAAEITHFSHNHQLALCYMTRSPDGLAYRCADCREPLEGLAYRCLSCKYRDRFMVHKRCAELPWKLDHPLHPQHPLTLQSSKDSYCVASRLATEGSSYCCEECQFFLSAKAAFLNQTLKHQPHEHDLTYFDKCGRDPCNYCGNRCNVDSYVCILCNFNVHYSCISLLPLTIKHEIHFHPVVLRDKYVTYHEEQYCDACESTRRPDRGVYFCAECEFATHIGCVIPSVKIEQSELDKLNEELTSVKAKIKETEENIKAMQKNLEALKETEKELTAKQDELTNREHGK